MDVDKNLSLMIPLVNAYFHNLDCLPEVQEEEMYATASLQTQCE